MSRFRKRKGRSESPADPAEAVAELLDRRHRRASITDGGRLLVEPGQVLDNITEAMERLDLDIDTEISIEEDVATFDEIVGLVESMLMGPTLAAHVVNNAVRIMAARYPADLVVRPLPAEYDVRKMLPGMQFADSDHETAKQIFNRRLATDVDLDAGDLADDMDAMDAKGQIQVFVALFLMYGHKLGAIKNRTGID